MTDLYQLFGIPASLYTAKVRSYLRKQRIPFVERAVGDPYYSEKIVPEIGRMIMPVLETPGGKLIQDGADIIDFFERGEADSTPGSSRPAYPKTPMHRAVSFLFELFGGEGLLRPAMHYRWDFDEINLDYLKDEFCAGIVPGADQETKKQVFDFASARMRGVATGFGVNPETTSLIEKSFSEFLGLFAEHLSLSPYLLGGHPTIGDYGLIGPFYAHLARDPYPAQFVRREAPPVSRWVERMQAPEQVAVEYGTLSEDLFEDDSIPQTLKNLMAFVAQEYLPEIEAHVSFANEWLEAHPGIPVGTIGLDDPTDRAIGKAEFNWRGETIETLVLPYRFYLLQRLQDSVARANHKDQLKIKNLFVETGLGSLLEIKTNRRVERENHLEIWGAGLNI